MKKGYIKTKYGIVAPKRLVEEWDIARSEFIAEHNGDLLEAAKTLARLAYISLFNLEGTIVTYKLMLEGKKFVPVILSRIMKDYCKIKRAKEKARECSRKYRVLLAVCKRSGIDIPKEIEITDRMAQETYQKSHAKEETG